MDRVKKIIRLVNNNPEISLRDIEHQTGVDKNIARSILVNNGYKHIQKWIKL